MGIDAETQRVIEKVQRELDEIHKKEREIENQKKTDDNSLEIKVPETIEVHKEAKKEKFINKLISITTIFGKMSTI